MASEDVGSGCVRSGTQGCEIRDAVFDRFNFDFFSDRCSFFPLYLL